MLPFLHFKFHLIFIIVDLLRLRNNEKYLADLIGQEAIALVTKLGDKRTRTPLALTNEQYLECNLKPKLGSITEYYGLGDISDIFHIPIPFLNKNHFYKRDNIDENFYPLGKAEILKKEKQLKSFKRRFNRILDNIMALIQNDSGMV